MYIPNFVVFPMCVIEHPSLHLFCPEFLHFVRRDISALQIADLYRFLYAQIEMYNRHKNLEIGSSPFAGMSTDVHTIMESQFRASSAT